MHFYDSNFKQKVMKNCCGSITDNISNVNIFFMEEYDRVTNMH